MRRTAAVASPLVVIACALAWWAAWPQGVRSHATLTTTVLFDREIVRILNTRCVMCHDDRALSFPLVTYEQTWLARLDIRTEVLRRHMPPWPAVAGYGQFANDNGLTVRESQFMIAWAEGLGPRNAGTVFLNVADPAAERRREIRARADVGHWHLGQPDLTRRLDPQRIGAREPDAVRRTVIDLGLTSERRVRGLEYMPGDRRVVRAVVFTLEQTGQWLGSWTPWYGETRLPDDVAYRLPAGARIVAEIHARGADEPVVDAGMLALFFADEATSRTPVDLTLETAPADPAGGRRLRAAVRLTEDTHVWAMRPEFDAGLTSIEVVARRPDGGTDVLLFARDPSPEWPTPYILQEPRRLMRGTELSVVGYYDEAAAPRAPALQVVVSRY